MKASSWAMLESLSRLLRLDEAETAMGQAIDICDDTFTAAAGAFRGALANLGRTQSFR